MMPRTPIETQIRARIATQGPLPVADYMAMCLADPQHGYYVTRDPLGARGDFVTAPEVSQMFGELIGVWIASVWQQMGAPRGVRIVELGPGRGTLMSDALRALKVMPALLETASVRLVEISLALKAKQQESLRGVAPPVSWHASLDDVPDGPAIVIANEFFDALPVHQAVKTPTGWCTRCVGVAADTLIFVAGAPVDGLDTRLPASARNAPENSIFEWRDDDAATALGRRLARQGGAALVIDYGHAASAVGDTLQALGRHAFADPLATPGELDLTAHVDFEALMRAAASGGAAAFGPITQGELLQRLGIATRAAKLKEKASADAAARIDAALARLTAAGRSGMGALFKAAAFAHPALGAPAAFER
ncbi:MAG: class I SAM-dependent methyltransferase [Pseudolabrys sp.]